MPLVCAQSASPILSEDKKPGSFAPTSPLLSPTVNFISRFIPAIFQVLKYIEDDLQLILKAVLDIRSPAARKHSDKPHKRAFKSQTPDIYKGMSHIDY